MINCSLLRQVFYWSVIVITVFGLSVCSCEDEVEMSPYGFPQY